MDKIKIEKEAIVLDEEERRKLIVCLDHCYHRLNYYSDTGLPAPNVDIDFVDYMRKNL